MFKKLFKKRSNQEIKAIVDIGSTKIVCLIGYINFDYEVQVIGIGYSETNGFKDGIITDKNLFENSLLTAIESAEKNAKIRIDKVIITLSTSKMQSHIVNTKLELNGNIINENDINISLKYSLNKFDSSKYEIIHYFMSEFNLDDVSDIKNPIGLFGHALNITIHVITLPVSVVFNLVNSFANCQLDVEQIYSSHYMSIFSFIDEDYAEDGVTLFEIGGANSTISIFKNENLLYLKTIPLGGINVTNDIAKTLMINFKNAERIKTINGSAIVTFADNYKMFDLPAVKDSFDDKGYSSISSSELNNIISARIEEILTILYNYVEKNNDIDKSILSKIVVLGGSSLLPGMKELMLNLFKCRIKIAKPKLLDGISSEEETISLAPIIGYVNFYIANKKKLFTDEPANSFNKHKKNFILSFFQN